MRSTLKVITGVALAVGIAAGYSLLTSYNDVGTGTASTVAIAQTGATNTSSTQEVEPTSCSGGRCRTGRARGGNQSSRKRCRRGNRGGRGRGMVRGRRGRGGCGNRGQRRQGGGGCGRGRGPQQPMSFMANLMAYLPNNQQSEESCPDATEQTELLTAEGSTQDNAELLCSSEECPCDDENSCGTGGEEPTTEPQQVLPTSPPQ
jgi:hypothetical protein